MGNCLKKIMDLFRNNKIHRISGKKLRQIKQIAEGGYGYVLLVQDVQTKKDYALKKLICQTEEQKQNYKNEVKVMKQLSNCKNVVGYFGAHEINRDGFLQAYILMELAQKTVYDLLLEHEKKGTSLSESLILKILLQTANGLSEMHSQGIIHQDVKVQNILLARDGTAKLCDLGSCNTEKVDLSKVPKSQVYKYQQRFQRNTTLMYRPPEMIDLYLKYPVDERVDVWMLGCVLYVLIYHYHPFQEEGKLSIVNASIRYPAGVSNKLEDLMRHMLTPNPFYRPMVAQIIQIIKNWDKIDQIEINAVAKIIKKNQEYIRNGQYELASQNEWRSLRGESNE